MKTATFRIEGMHCEGCARTIEALVAQVPGVERVAVSFDGREAVMEFDAEATDDASLVAAIERAGYKVALAGP